ncbi:hypothetical protein V498_09172 [Pseudogymnoascus sp. VKM F-4517 (FW-2822)]|nr:hypothetical protein V498_09172 [Pseudogymnoascus sp. VKM F-4517 (FW-2822)]
MADYLDTPKSLLLANDFVRKGIHSRGGASGGKDLCALQIWATLPEICALSWWSHSPQAIAIKKAIACLCDSGADGLSLDNAGRTALSRAIYANNTVMCGALLKQYKISTVAPSGTITVHGIQEAKKGQEYIKYKYQEDVQDCWFTVIETRKWHMVEVFLTSNIALDMAPLSPFMMEFFVHALVQDVGPVLAEFTKACEEPAKPDVPEYHLRIKDRQYQYAHDSARPRLGIFSKLLKLKKHSIVVLKETKTPVLGSEIEEKTVKSELPREVLHRFWKEEILNSDFDMIEKLIPGSSQPGLAHMIIKNGLVEKVDKMNKALQGMVQTYGVNSINRKEFLQSAPVRDAVKESSILVANVKLLTTLTYVSQMDRSELVVSFARLLSTQSEIQLLQLDVEGYPAVVESLGSGLDLLDIRTNACINFIRETAFSSPVLAMSHGFRSIGLLQGLHQPSTGWAQAPTFDTKHLAQGADVYSVIEPEVEKIITELVEVSLVTIKYTASASIYQRGWLHVFSMVKFTAIYKIRFPYSARVILNTPSISPRSFELESRADVEILIPVGRWWLARGPLGNIGFMAAEKLKLQDRSRIYNKTFADVYSL